MILSSIKTIAFIALFTLAGTTAFAQNNGTETHEVEAGQTLFSIAREYDISVDELRDWNNIEDEGLSTGQVLYIQPPSDDEAIVHEVQAQETLFSISKQYNVSIAEIRSWNDLEGNNLSLGQELEIYPNSGSNEQENQESIITAGQSSQSNTYYTVKSGDTLYRIANEHDMSVDELRELNSLENDNLSVGQQLTVKKTRSTPSLASGDIESSPQGTFVEHQLEQPQQLEDILSEFQMDEQEFHALNPDISGDSFERGQRLTLLAPPSRTYTNPYKMESGMSDLGDTRVSTYNSSDNASSTTNGELYNPEQLTGAHSNISLGSVIFVQNPETQKGIYVRINDRTSGNGLKLSRAAYLALGFEPGQSGASVKIYQDQ